MEKVIIASDHAGFELKEYIKHSISACGLSMIDAGCANLEQTDYPLYVAEAIILIKEHKAKYGVFVCGSGIGVSIAANRHKGIRAALCHSIEYARLARQHNDANVLCLGGRYMDKSLAEEIISTFLTTPFSGQKRYAMRNQMLDN